MALINEKKKILKATDKLSLFSTSKNFKIPVIFHNLKNYDAHLIINELGTITDTVMNN